MQRLTCTAGHEWVRAPAPGRPPRACPEHASPVSRQAAERHRVFYAPHPRAVVVKVSRSPEERSESARRAALARWSTTTPEERSAAASRAALAMHAKAGHSAPVPVTG